jgi:hypothetical protein
MPPIGTRIPDPEGLALIERWIASEASPAPSLAPVRTCPSLTGAILMITRPHIFTLASRLGRRLRLADPVLGRRRRSRWQGPARPRRTRPLPGQHQWLPRLPHALQDGRQRPRARHEPHAVGPPRAAGHATGAKLPPGPWLIVSAATNTAHAGPWGVSFTANLTPDADTGLGRWTREGLQVSTIRSGRHMGKGRPVLPPMPIPVYRNFTDADLGHLQLPAHRAGGEEPGARAAAAGSGGDCRPLSVGRTFRDPG